MILNFWLTILQKADVLWFTLARKSSGLANAWIRNYKTWKNWLMLCSPYLCFIFKFTWPTNKVLNRPSHYSIFHIVLEKSVVSFSKGCWFTFIRTIFISSSYCSWIKQKVRPNIMIFQTLGRGLQKPSGWWH